MEVRETEKHCSLVQISCNQGIAGMGMEPEKLFQAYETREGKKFTKLKFLEEYVICVRCKIKPWADSTVWVMSSSTAPLHVFRTCF